MNCDLVLVLVGYRVVVDDYLCAWGVALVAFLGVCVLG